MENFVICTVCKGVLAGREAKQIMVNGYPGHGHKKCVVTKKGKKK